MSVRLPVQEGDVVEASWKPELTYVVRIRQTGADKPWSLGFETPLTHISFTDLKPDTEYEVKVCTRDAAGEGKPRLFRVSTNATGQTDNVTPLPRH